MSAPRITQVFKLYFHWVIDKKISFYESTFQAWKKIFNEVTGWWHKKFSQWFKTIQRYDFLLWSPVHFCRYYINNVVTRKNARHFNFVNQHVTSDFFWKWKWRDGDGNFFHNASKYFKYRDFLSYRSLIYFCRYCINTVTRKNVRK